MRFRLRFLSAVFILFLVMGGQGPLLAQSASGNLVSRTALRVCADPSDLPFSNQQGEGFENKIAELFARELALPVEYVWFPQVTGFMRNTLLAGRCDVVMGTVAGDEDVETTSPYYFTGYVIVFRNGSDWSFTGWDDPKLKEMRIGLIARTPPADLLLRHALLTRAVPYPLTVDTRADSPSRRMLADIASGTIDAGLLWGPLAGYYIQHDKLPLSMVLLKSEPSAPRLDFHIAIGLRRNEIDWRRRLNSLIHAKQGEITQILADYGVPLLNEKGEALQTR
jgi:quinoprotein dehydrogenase-associated probable ABC transporter substrate-binding protein